MNLAKYTPFLLSIASTIRDANAGEPFTTYSELIEQVDNYCQDADSIAGEYGEIEQWDVSQITNMESLFEDEENCNPDVSEWDVSGVTYFKQMFRKATAFNQDIGEWDVSNASYFYGMFYGATSFDQDIGRWNMAESTSFGYMFYGTTSFNQDIGSWDVSKGFDFKAMFFRAPAFDEYIGDWDMSSSFTYEYMFDSATSFNQNVASWGPDLSEIGRYSRMFNQATSFYQDLSSWPETAFQSNDFCTGAICDSTPLPTVSPIPTTSLSPTLSPTATIAPTVVPSLEPSAIPSVSLAPTRSEFTFKWKDDGVINEGFPVGSTCLFFCQYSGSAQSFIAPVDGEITKLRFGMCQSSTSGFYDPTGDTITVTINKDNGNNEPGNEIAEADRLLQPNNLPFFPDYRVKASPISATVTQGEKYWIVFSTNNYYTAGMAFLVGKDNNPGPGFTYGEVKTRTDGPWQSRNNADIYFAVTYRPF